MKTTHGKMTGAARGEGPGAFDAERDFALPVHWNLRRASSIAKAIRKPRLPRTRRSGCRSRPCGSSPNTLSYSPALREKSGDGGELCLLLERFAPVFCPPPQSWCTGSPTVRRGELDDLGPTSPSAAPSPRASRSAATFSPRPQRAKARAGGAALEGDVASQRRPSRSPLTRTCSVELV